MDTSALRGSKADPVVKSLETLVPIITNSAPIVAGHELVAFWKPAAAVNENKGKQLTWAQQTRAELASERKRAKR